MFDRAANGRKGNDGVTTEDVSRRLMLARVIEFTALAPLAGLGMKSAFDHRDYATINSDRALRGELGGSEQTVQMSNSFAQISASLDSLQSAYRDAYLKTRMVPYTTTDGNGHPTVRLRIERYWAEEAGVPHHATIDDWKEAASAVQSKIRELSSPELIDSNRVKQLLVEAKQVGTLNQIGGSLVLYGAQIAAVLGYEELLGLHEQGGSVRQQLSESKEQVRRGFFKTAATALGLGAAFAITGKINERLASGTARMDKAVERAASQAVVENGAAFQGHFGSSPQGLIEEISTQRQQIEVALRDGVSNKNVQTAMRRFQSTAKAMEEALRNNFMDGVFDEFADACKSAIITETIKKARSGESSLGEFAIAIEGLTVGGVMAATIVSLEVADSLFAKSDRSRVD